ncbi:hypothetical protein [Tateyamaria sp. syn59]|uniref:hypothetical protein n=1 Tax=Tateyamaria sp. syn59 TaxID=2576942 RepID=UPI0011BECD60|nr:hypothetical protein [Tateyamaria sp. syn59]
MSKLMSPSDDVKFAIERYSDIVKLRAAQVLALFIVYAFSLRGSEEFLDGASILALAIPFAAWIFDLIARRQYMCPYAYAAAHYAFHECESQDKREAVDSVPNLVLDFAMGPRSEAHKIFMESDDEMTRRRRFQAWFTWKDQSVAGLIFATFFVIALAATGAFNHSEENVSVPPETETSAPADG